MKKFLKLINDERKNRPLLATARIRPYCICESDGFNESENCGLDEGNECNSPETQDFCYECFTKNDDQYEYPQ